MLLHLLRRARTCTCLHLHFAAAAFCLHCLCTARTRHLQSFKKL